MSSDERPAGQTEEAVPGHGRTPTAPTARGDGAADLITKRVSRGGDRDTGQGGTSPRSGRAASNRRSETCGGETRSRPRPRSSGEGARSGAHREGDCPSPRRGARGQARDPYTVRYCIQLNSEQRSGEEGACQLQDYHTSVSLLITDPVCQGHVPVMYVRSMAAEDIVFELRKVISDKVCVSSPSTTSGHHVSVLISVDRRATRPGLFGYGGPGEITSPRLPRVPRPPYRSSPSWSCDVM